jgi:hypothetical protein
MRDVAERIPTVRRYALVPNDSDKGVRRFHLARVAAPRARRLERMEDVAAREASPQGGGSDPSPQG